jgi:tetratricopeptide (TPR) repeat protein
VAHDRVGDALAAQGKLDEALQSYRDERAILDRLTKSDPNNALWQRDLSVALGKIGDVLLAQGNTDAALASYADDLAIAKRLAERSPDNAGWQRDLAVSYNKLGSAEKAQGNLDQALKSYEQGRDLMQRLVEQSRLLKGMRLRRSHRTATLLPSATGWLSRIPTMPTGSAISPSPMAAWGSLWRNRARWTRHSPSWEREGLSSQA